MGGESQKGQAQGLVDDGANGEVRRSAGRDHAQADDEPATPASATQTACC